MKEFFVTKKKVGDYMKLFKKVDKAVFGFGMAIYLFLFLFIFIMPGIASVVIDDALDFTLNTAGWIFIFVYIFALIMFLFFGLSKYGKIRLGKDDSRPKYSFFSWMAMLFCAGLGVGLVFFGVAEPMSHFVQAPFAENGTVQAASDAMKITFFHWGIMPWAMYGMIGLCMAYFTFRKGLPGLVSSSLAPILGYDNTRGKIGKMVDTFALIATICGASMSLGFAANQFTAGLHVQYGVSNSFLTVCIVATVIGLLAMFSSLHGIEKGIKRFSDFNLYLVIFFLVFAFTFGAPIVYLLETFFQGLGAMFSDFVEMSFFMDAYGTVEEKLHYDWISDWTVMYWAWWAAFGPFVGGFLADISQGRTIREFVLACTFVPAVLCCLWFAFFGGGSIYLELFKGAGIGEAIVADSNNSLFIFLKELPLSVVSIPLALVLIVTLIVTSVDSANYVAGSFCEGGAITPSTSSRAFWSVFVIINAIAFMMIGGLDTLKKAAIVLALPFVVVMVLMIVSLYKDMRESSQKAK